MLLYAANVYIVLLCHWSSGLGVRALDKHSEGLEFKSWPLSHACRKYQPASQTVTDVNVHAQ